MTDPADRPRDRLSQLALALQNASPDLSLRLADEVRRRVAIYRVPALMTEQELLDSCSAHVDFVCSRDHRDAKQDDVARSIGAARSRASIPLSDVLDAVRVGSEYIWNEIVAYARSAGAASDADLVSVAGEVWSMSDAFAELISAGFHQQEAHRIINSQRERYALIDTVLSGHDQPTATLWQAIDRIGFPRDRPFTVVAVETAGMARVPTHRIESLLRDHDMESAWMLRSDVELGVVSCFGEQIPGLRASVEHFRVRAGISPVFTDFGNAPHAVRLARTALAAAPKGRVLYFADSAIGTMAAGAPDVASELTSIVLYGLLEMPKQERDVILDTVRTWFGASGSVAETARSMFVHPNTVRNRLRRLEVLTMRRLSDPRQAAEIYLAIVSLSQ